MGQSNLPEASGERHARTFVRLGWERKPKAGKGSHIILTKKGAPTLSIPNHRVVKRTLLAAQLKRANITEHEYLEAFR